MKSGLSIEAEAAVQVTPGVIQQLHPAPHQAIAMSCSQPSLHLPITAFPQPVPFPTGHHTVHTFTVPGALMETSLQWDWHLPEQFQQAGLGEIAQVSRITQG